MKVVNQTLAEFVSDFIERRSSLQSDIIKPASNGRHIDCIVQLERFDAVAVKLYEFLDIPFAPSVLSRLNTSSSESWTGFSSELRSKLKSYLAPDLDTYDRLAKQNGILFC